MRSVALITGAGRGIGLELSRLLLDRDYTVVACPLRAGEEGLAALACRAADRLAEIEMDVASDASVAAAALRISARVECIDLLINNAGIYPQRDDSIETFDSRAHAEAFEINAIGPLRVVHALLPLLRAGNGKRVVQITSVMGSIDDNTSGGSYGYRMSKAALNMATRNLAHDLGPQGFLTFAIHPGWVKTRMGGPSAPTELVPAAAEVLRLVLESGPQASGKFIGPGGETLPW